MFRGFPSRLAACKAFRSRLHNPHGFGRQALVSPPDLIEALERYPNAKHHFGAFPPSPKRGVLESIKQAKKPDTRAKRIEEMARLAETNDRASQFKR